MLPVPFPLMLLRVPIGPDAPPMDTGDGAALLIDDMTPAGTFADVIDGAAPVAVCRADSTGFALLALNWICGFGIFTGCSSASCTSLFCKIMSEGVAGRLDLLATL